jgi:hypothetical protein
MNLTTLFGGLAFRDWFAQFIVVLFLAAGVALLAIGLGLLFNSAGTLRFFSRMNRWVSTRRTLRPVEIPRETGEAVQKYRRWIGVVFIAGGLFAIYGLLAQYNAKAAILLLGLEIFKPAFASWVVDSARWVLVAGNLAGIVVGVLLVFFPQALAGLEARGARWYSERHVVRDREKMNLALDNWVERFPRVAGCIITFFALVLIGAFGLLLPAIR